MLHSISKNQWNCLKWKLNCLVVSPWSLKGKHCFRQVNIYCMWNLYFNRPDTAGPKPDSSYYLEPVSVLFSSWVLYCSQLLNPGHTHAGIFCLPLLTNADQDERLSPSNHSQQRSVSEEQSVTAKSGFLHLPFTHTQFPSNGFVCNMLVVLSLAPGTRTPDDKYGFTIRL